MCQVQEKFYRDFTEAFCVLEFKRLLIFFKFSQGKVMITNNEINERERNNKEKKVKPAGLQKVLRESLKKVGSQQHYNHDRILYLNVPF
jgi:hypothetical protein